MQSPARRAQAAAHDIDGEPKVDARDWDHAERGVPGRNPRSSVATRETSGCNRFFRLNDSGRVHPWSSVSSVVKESPL
jgi:hypothetical protein